MELKHCLILLACYVFLLLCGGLSFHLLEYTNEQDLTTTTRNTHMTFLSDYSCVTPEALEAMVSAIVKAYDAGVIATNTTTSGSNWDFRSSLFFSTTVLTTIGYGHISPSTAGGRAFCVIYALIGIPITALLLAHIGKKLKSVAIHYSKKATSCRPSRRLKQTNAITSVFILSVGVVLFLFVPAIIFWAAEDWTYSEALYYGVITLTTVGFGDFVAGVSDDNTNYWPSYKLLVALWIILGLAWLSMVISDVQDYVDEYLRNKIDYKRDDEKADKELESVSEKDVQIKS